MVVSFHVGRRRQSFKIRFFRQKSCKILKIDRFRFTSGLKLWHLFFPNIPQSSTKFQPSTINQSKDTQSGPWLRLGHPTWAYCNLKSLFYLYVLKTEIKKLFSHQWCLRIMIYSPVLYKSSVRTPKIRRFIKPFFPFDDL